MADVPEFISTDRLLDVSRDVIIDYTNWRGVRRERRIRPVPGGLKFTATTFHKDEQWLVEALDLESNQLRGFILANIHSWRPA